jgi:hypothetical protein
MSQFEQGEVRVDVVEGLRALAGQGADVPELVEFLQRRLGLNQEGGILATMVYFRAAFALSLREVLPLREWIGGKDRSEIDSILIPAMQHAKSHWQPREAVQA